MTSMEVPLFSLSTKPDLSIWKWESQDGKRWITVTPSVLGRATQHDKDVLIYAISQLTAGVDRSLPDVANRAIRFTAYDYLLATNRGVSGRDYTNLKESACPTARHHSDHEYFDGWVSNRRRHWPYR